MCEHLSHLCYVCMCLKEITAAPCYSNDPTGHYLKGWLASFFLVVMEYYLPRKCEVSQWCFIKSEANIQLAHAPFLDLVIVVSR